MTRKLARDQFDHRTLDVYLLAEQFFGAMCVFTATLRTNDWFFRAQLLRAALSIMANIAEACGEWRPAEKARIYRIARRSAEECAALLDGTVIAFQISPEELDEHYRVIIRIMQMLLALIQRHEESAAAENERPRKKSRKP